MNLQFITCSGTNEYTDIPELVRLLEEYPMTEIGVQVSHEKCYFFSPRWEWINSLIKYVNKKHIVINAALHINLKWVEAFSTGSVPSELICLLNYRDCNGDIFFKRAQLNFKIGREKILPDKIALTDNIRHYRNTRFILSYNDSNAALIRGLYRNGVVFDCLYDESFGKGLVPAQRRTPAFADIVQGYAGGISPDNVCDVLDQIQIAWQKSPSSKGIYIDAQGKLEDEQEHLDLNKARKYVERAYEWKLAHRFEF